MSDFSLLRHLFPEPRDYLIAYSGGMDSHVLLHQMADLQSDQRIQNLRAVHVDHGLQTESPSWTVHCQQTAQALGVSCEIIRLNLKPAKGESIEAVARDARYGEFARLLKPDEVLLTAQHQDDQVETLLLQLLRGAGVDGLASMPSLKTFAKGYHLRPLLNQTRNKLEQYAQQHHLDYVDDPSNSETQYDRNYLRHQVIPLLEQRWKGLGKRLSRVARLQSETKQLLEEYTEQDLLAVKDNVAKTLSVSALKQLSPLKQKAVIRLWLQRLQFRMPSEVKLQHIVDDAVYAQSDANPYLHWENVELRRFNDQLYAFSKLSKHDPKQVLFWDLQNKLFIESLDQELEPQHLLEWQPELVKTGDITVRFRQGGERIHLEGKKQTITLKNLFQQANIPPWERQRIPLIYQRGELIMVYPDWKAVI